jgi:hypothetical protein
MTNPKQLKARFLYMFEGENIGFEFYRGWFLVFAKLCEDIDALFGDDKRGFHWVQIKEKFGSARFYWAMKGYTPNMHFDFIGTDGVAALMRKGAVRAKGKADTLPALSERIDVLVREAAQATRNLCLVCGQPGTVNEDSSWLLTLCELHAQQRREGKLDSAGFNEKGL